MEALSRDVKCFEAFEMLVGGEMMSSEEGASRSPAFRFSCARPDVLLRARRVGLHPGPALSRPDRGRRRVRPHDVHGPPQEGALALSFSITSSSCAHRTDSSPSTQISHNNDMAIARQRLSGEYGLGNDPDVLCSRADELHSAMRYAECFKITTQCVFSRSLCLAASGTAPLGPSLTPLSLSAQHPVPPPLAPPHLASAPLVHAPPAQPALQAVPRRARHGRQRAGRRDQLVRRRPVVLFRQTVGGIAQVLRVRLALCLSFESLSAAKSLTS